VSGRTLKVLDTFALSHFLDNALTISGLSPILSLFSAWAASTKALTEHRLAVEVFEKLSNYFSIIAA
jgi:hypothetical protein